MDKEFNDWAEEFEKDWRDSKAYQNMAGKGYNEHTKQLITLYMQYKSSEKLFKMTRWLVLGTWVLAIATFLLVFFKG